MIDLDHDQVLKIDHDRDPIMIPNTSILCAM